jgi:hypothetical protein
MFSKDLSSSTDALYDFFLSLHDTTTWPHFSKDLLSSADAL